MDEDFEPRGDIWSHDAWAEVYSNSHKSLIKSFQYNQITPTIATGRYKYTYILIDTSSTTSVLNNSKMLLDIQKSDKTLRYYSNGETQDSNWKGLFPRFFQSMVERVVYAQYSLVQGSKEAFQYYGW